MSDLSVDQVLRDLAAELAVEPSAGLTARIRGMVRHSAKRPRFIPGWQALVGMTFVIAAVALGVEPGRRRTQDVFPVSQRDTRGGTLAAVPFMATAKPSLSPGRANSGRHTAASPRSRVMRRGPEVLVPPDQAVALARILSAMRTRGSPVPPAIVLAVDANGQLPPPRVIEVPEITIEPLGPPVGGGRGKER